MMQKRSSSKAEMPVKGEKAEGKDCFKANFMGV